MERKICRDNGPERGRERLLVFEGAAIGLVWLA